MNFTVVNMKLKDGRFMSSLYGKGSIFAIGKDFNESSDYLESMLSEIILMNAKGEGVFEHKDISPEYVDMNKVIKDYEKDADGTMFVSVIKIDEKVLLSDVLKTERTNVSIKKAYKIIAKKKGINISEFVNQKLKKELKVSF